MLIAESRIPIQSDGQVTRATIILAQEDDPFAKEQEKAPSDPVQDDPAQDELRNPFADPPADILEREQLPDPFSDPPADFQDDQQQRDPFGNPFQDPPQDTTDPFDNVDPFAKEPNDLTPPDDFQFPDDPELDDPDAAPSRPPKNQDSVLDSYSDSDNNNTGPYQQDGFRRKRLLPAPPNREFPDLGQQIVPPGYNVDPQLRQPTLAGHEQYETSHFEESQLYDGVNYDHNTQLASYECDSCRETSRDRLGLFDDIRKRLTRWGLRKGNYQYQTYDSGYCAPHDAYGEPVYDSSVVSSRALGSNLTRSNVIGSGNVYSSPIACNTCNEPRRSIFGIGSTASRQSVSRRGTDRSRWSEERGSLDAGSMIQCGPCADQYEQPVEYMMAQNWAGNCSPCNPGYGLQFDSTCCCEPMFYYSLFGGFTTSNDISGLGPGPSFETGVLPVAGALQFDDGFGAGFAIGQWQGRNLRSELEYSYRRNAVATLQRTTLSGTDIQGIDGSIDVHAGLTNLYWDFNRFRMMPQIKFYAGAGAGFAFLNVDVNSLDGGSLTRDDRNSSFAYQLIAGASRQVNQRTELFVDYRYFRAESLQIEVAEFGGDEEYETHNIFFGFRRRF